MKERGISFLVRIKIEKDNGEFHVFCPALKGLHTSGKTLKEAKENVTNAIVAYINSLIKHREPIPLEVIEQEKPEKEHQPKFQSCLQVTV